MMKEKKYLGMLGAVWGFTGAFALIGFAVWRLAPLVLHALQHSLSLLQWTSLIGCVVLMAYSEGYRGFQLAFAPRVAARSLYLSQHPTLPRLLFAPFFVIGYFDATRRRMVTSYLLTGTIIILVFLVHQLEQPWRGIIDAGVVTGLAWGLLAMLYFAARAFSTEDYAYPADVPATDTE